MRRSKLVIALIAAAAWPSLAFAQPSAAGEKPACLSLKPNNRRFGTLWEKRRGERKSLPD